MKIYLAHSPTERERGYKVQKALEEANHEVINPFDLVAKPYNLEKIEGEFLDADEIHLLRKSLPKKKAINIVDVDILEVITSDLIICLYPLHLKTIGISQEMVYAHLFRVFTITFIIKEYLEHPWLIKHSDLIFHIDREEDIIEIVKEVEK